MRLSFRFFHQLRDQGFGVTHRTLFVHKDVVMGRRRPNINILFWASDAAASSANLISGSKLVLTKSHCGPTRSRKQHKSVACRLIQEAIDWCHSHSRVPLTPSHEVVVLDLLGDRICHASFVSEGRPPNFRLQLGNGGAIG